MLSAFPQGSSWPVVVDAGEAPRMFKTLLHPDKGRSWAEVFVVAIDLNTLPYRKIRRPKWPLA